MSEYNRKDVSLHWVDKNTYFVEFYRLYIMSYTELAQLELMNAAANVTSKDDLDALRLTLSLFFAERAQQAIDKMWDEGTFDQKKLDELRGQHLRTPYKTF